MAALVLPKSSQRRKAGTTKTGHLPRLLCLAGRAKRHRTKCPGCINPQARRHYLLRTPSWAIFLPFSRRSSILLSSDGQIAGPQRAALTRHWPDVATRRSASHVPARRFVAATQMSFSSTLLARRATSQLPTCLPCSAVGSDSCDLPSRLLRFGPEAHPEAPAAKSVHGTMLEDSAVPVESAVRGLPPLQRSR